MPKSTAEQTKQLLQQQADARDRAIAALEAFPESGSSFALAEARSAVRHAALAQGETPETAQSWVDAIGHKMRARYLTEEQSTASARLADLCYRSHDLDTQVGEFQLLCLKELDPRHFAHAARSLVEDIMLHGVSENDAGLMVQMLRADAKVFMPLSGRGID